MAGIALGVAALIVVLSVMNGFQKELRTRILSVASHIEVRGLPELANGTGGDRGASESARAGGGALSLGRACSPSAMRTAACWCAASIPSSRTMWLTSAQNIATVRLPILTPASSGSSSVASSRAASDCVPATASF